MAELYLLESTITSERVWLSTDARYTPNAFEPTSVVAVFTTDNPNAVIALVSGKVAQYKERGGSIRAVEMQALAEQAVIAVEGGPANALSSRQQQLQLQPQRGGNPWSEVNDAVELLYDKLVVDTGVEARIPGLSIVAKIIKKVW